MAKLVEKAYVFRISRLVKDGTDETSVLPEALASTIEEIVSELIADPLAIIEVSELNDD